MNSVSTVAYPLLFATTAFVFVFASLLLGRFLHPKLPVSAKREIYECGEPTIGSSSVQFDLRFYVVALVFIVFEVEAAFFSPGPYSLGRQPACPTPICPRWRRPPARPSPRQTEPCGFRE